MTFNDYWRAMWRQVLVNRTLFWMLEIPLLLGFSYIALFAVGYFRSIDWIILTCCFAPLLAYALMSYRRARNAVQVSLPTTFRFSLDGVEITNEVVNGKMNWQAYQKIIETKTDFLLSPQKNQFTPIPKRFFANEAQIQSFRDFAQINLNNKAKLLK